MEKIQGFYGISDNVANPVLSSNIYQNDNQYTTVSYRKDPGYFERVGGSCMGIFVGLFVLIAAFPVLFLNEGRAVRTAQSLDEGLNSVVLLTSSENVHESNNKKLVHLSGKLRTEMALTDNEFGISIFAVKLKRHVEMYQWIEHENKREYKEGDQTRIETTYSYSKEWQSEIINSGRFNVPTLHQNPNTFPISSFNKEADPVFLGSFRLSKGLLAQINTFHQINLKKKPDHREDLHLLDNYFYRSTDPYHAQVGDIRVSFTYSGLSGELHQEHGNQAEVSVIAQQNGNFLSSYQTNAGDRLEILYPGIKSAKEIFDSEQSANTFLTWLLRFVGWLMMFIALQIMMDIFRQIVSFLPIIRDIVGLATSVLAFTFATSMALVTIAIGWLSYRPLLACTLLAAAVLPLVISRYKSKESKKKNDN
ncbi:transmembrane protein 43 isoform X3 [Hydra vulgaris]|uniref:Transmembrane protein 43 isoform X3 n=1 Tax=Hydra vulgaris TaxID=6087 RepID=A0ABM4DIL2_HYDVU